MFGLAQNIKYLCESNKYGWDADGWQKIAVCIGESFPSVLHLITHDIETPLAVSDGRSKVHPNVLKVLEIMGVYQDGLAQAAVNSESTTSRKFLHKSPSLQHILTLNPPT